MTLVSSESVTTSPSRLQLAHENGLDCTSEALQSAAGLYGDVATLVLAHKLGMNYTAVTMAGAAQRNNLL
eukprot:12105-Heterococcus_DN1.PRE.1